MIVRKRSPWLYPLLDLLLFPYLYFISFTTENKHKLEWYDIATAEEKIKLKWTDKITEMVTELMYICFHNNHLFLEQIGTVSSNYSRLSICQMFLFHETLL